MSLVAAALLGYYAWAVYIEGLIVLPPGRDSNLTNSSSRLPPPRDDSFGRPAPRGRR